MVSQGQPRGHLDSHGLRKRRSGVGPALEAVVALGALLFDEDGVEFAVFRVAEGAGRRPKGANLFQGLKQVAFVHVRQTDPVAFATLEGGEEVLVGGDSLVEQGRHVVHVQVLVDDDREGVIDRRIGVAPTDQFLGPGARMIRSTAASAGPWSRRRTRRRPSRPSNRVCSARRKVGSLMIP